MSTRKRDCDFDRCKYDLLKKKPSDLTKQQRQHVTRCHKRTVHSVGVDNVVFTFRRDPSKHDQYTCVCGKVFSTCGSLRAHILGQNKQSPCIDIPNVAAVIANTKEVVDDEAKPINYRPAEQVIFEGLNDSRQDAGDLDNDEQDLDLDNDEHEELDLDNDEHEHDLHNDEHEELHLDNDELEDDLQSMLKASDQALADAIKSLKKARADIKKRLK
ncbi:hypothetical protein BGZ82_002811 [Podila clonocystis]|nr:hypothetical protein BGZ82_002811 [Podila clonocystis]